MTSLAGDLAASLDAALWAEGIGWSLDPWQAQALTSAHPRLLLNCCRQSGKSTVASLKALHTAIYRPRSLTLLLSPSQRQSKELFRKVLAGYRFLGRPVAAEAENQMSLALDNGSRVVSLPGNESTIRGYSRVGLLIIDEAAQVTDNLYRSVRPQGPGKVAIRPYCPMAPCRSPALRYSVCPGRKPELSNRHVRTFGAYRDFAGALRPPHAGNVPRSTPDDEHAVWRERLVGGCLAQ